MGPTSPLLSICRLTTCFRTTAGTVTAVDGVSLDVQPGQVLGIVGESGCGKTVLSLSILRLLPVPPAFFRRGQVFFEGRNLLTLNSQELRRIRGDRISMIFQEPMTALNPVFTVGDQLAEVYRVHRHFSRVESRLRAAAMLDRVGVPDPERRAKQYPFELSGGMRQRVMIAMALACRPKLLIADEPTTALDVTIQAQILDLMERLRSEIGMAVMLITHDLGVIAQWADEVAIMYTGRIVERAETIELFDQPAHPYTRGLMRAIPRAKASTFHEPLYEIPGVVPSLMKLPDGCAFHPRCPYADTVCREKKPPLEAVRPNHWAACWKSAEVMHA